MPVKAQFDGKQIVDECTHRSAHMYFKWGKIHKNALISSKSAPPAPIYGFEKPGLIRVNWYRFWSLRNILVPSARNLTVTFSLFLQEGTFSFATELTEVDFHQNRIPSLEINQWFGNNTNLRKMRFSTTYISSLSNMPFENFNKLVFLDLSGNGITHLSNQSFAGLMQVERLILSNNIISDIDGGTFTNLPLLVELRLDGNSLTSLPKNIFSALPSLQTLFLGDNRFSAITERFITSQSLTYFNFEDGSVDSIHAYAFHDIPNIRTLHLAYNAMHYVDDDAFTSTNDSLLVTLDLSHNRLTHVPANALSKLINVEFLDLSYNPIKTLATNYTAPTLNKLTQLYLSFTDVYDVTNDSFFISTPELHTVLLNDCQLSSIPTLMFQQLPFLENINFDHNPVARIRSAADHDKFPTVKSFSLRFSDQLKEVITEFTIYFGNEIRKNLQSLN